LIKFKATLNFEKDMAENKTGSAYQKKKEQA